MRILGGLFLPEGLTFFYLFYTIMFRFSLRNILSNNVFESGNKLN